MGPFCLFLFFPLNISQPTFVLPLSTEAQAHRGNLALLRILLLRIFDLTCSQQSDLNSAARRPCGVFSSPCSKFNQVCSGESQGAVPEQHLSVQSFAATRISRPAPDQELPARRCCVPSRLRIVALLYSTQQFSDIGAYPLLPCLCENQRLSLKFANRL